MKGGYSHNKYSRWYADEQGDFFSLDASMNESAMALYI